MRFADIPGLKETKRLLTESVRSSHAAHAQLFAGAPGALNLPMALAFATYLHCLNRGDDACGQCSACSKNLKYVHPDTHYVFPMNNVKKDKDEERFKAEILKSFRTFLLEQPFGSLDDWTLHYGGEDKQGFISKEESREIIKKLALKPFESAIKVMIIWQPELMHPAAANGILKILEEPSPHTHFILVTNAADRLLPTITSRTQIITIPLLRDEDLVTMLKKEGADQKNADHIAQLADGNVNLALKLLEEEEEDDYTERFTEWMRACFKKNYATLVQFADEYHAMDRLNQRNLLHYSMAMMRESLLAHSGAANIHRVHDDEREFVTNFSKVLDIKRIDHAYTYLNDASIHLERNGSAKMIFMDLSLKITQLLNPN